MWACVYRAHNPPDFVVSLSKLAMVVITKHVHLARVEEDGCGERQGSREVLRKWHRLKKGSKMSEKEKEQKK